MEARTAKTPAGEDPSSSSGHDVSEASAAPATRLQGARQRSTCLNCGTNRVGMFCQNCGQKYIDDPLTYTSLGKAFVDRVLDLDQGLMYTVRRLAVDPGEVSLEYIKGRQRPYAHPLAYMAITTAIFIALFGLTEPIVRAVTGDMLSEMFDQPDEVFTLVVDQFVKPYAALLFVLSCIPIAYVMQRVFARTASYTTAETLVFVLYCTAQATLYTGVCQLIVLLIPNATGVTLAQSSTLLLFPVIAHGAYGFYRKKAGDVVLALVTSIGAYVITVLIMALIGAAIGFIFAVVNSSIG